MRSYRTEKETYFNLYLKRRKRLLEKALGMKLSGLVLEKYWDGMKLDLFSLGENLGRPVMMETWLAKSNAYHQRKLLSMVDSLDEGDVVYLTPEFQSEHMAELTAKVRKSPKPLCISFLRVNETVNTHLARLEELNRLDVYGNLLDELDAVKPMLELVERVESPTYVDIMPRAIQNCVDMDFQNRATVNRYLIDQLRRHVPDFIPVHHEKHRVENHILTYGGGVTGVQYFLTPQDSRGIAFVELRFEANRRALFDYFRGLRAELRQKIDGNVVFQDGVIAVRFRPYPDVRRTVSELVAVFRDMVKTITREVYAMAKNQWDSRERTKTWTNVAKFPAMR